MARTTTDKIQLELTIGGKQAGATLKDLNGAAKTLNKELNNLTPGTEEFRNKAEQLRSVNARINEIKTQIKGVSTEMAKAGSGFKQFAGGVGDSLSSLIPLGTAAIAAFSVQKIVQFGQSAFAAFNEAENAAFDLRNAMVVLGGETEETLGRLMDQADFLEESTFGFTAEQIQGVQKQQKAFGLVGEQIEAITPLIVDYAAFMKKDLTSATDDVIAAFRGKKKALEVAGAEFGKGAISVSQMEEQLRKFKGTAASALDVASNRTEIFADKWGKVEEFFGGFLSDAAIRVIDWVFELGAVFTGIYNDLQPFFSTIYGFFKGLTDRFPILTKVAEFFNYAFAPIFALPKFLSAAAAGVTAFVNTTAEGWDALRKNALEIFTDIGKLLLTAVTNPFNIGNVIAEIQKDFGKAGFSVGESFGRNYEEALKKYSLAGNEPAKTKAPEYKDRAFKNEEETTKKVGDEAKKREDITKKEVAERVKTNEEGKDKLQANEKEITIDRQKEAQTANDLNKKQLESYDLEEELANRVSRAKIDLAILGAQTQEELLAARIAQIRNEAQIELQNLNLTAEEEKLIVAQRESDIAALEKEYRDRRLEEDRAALDMRKEQTEALTRLGQDGLNAIAEFTRIQTDKGIADAERLKEARIKKLEEEKSAGKISEKDYAKAKTQIEADVQGKISYYKRRAAKTDKEVAIFQSIINTLVAVTAALTKDPTGILATIVGAAGAIQTGLIAAKPIPEFRDGGIAEGPRHSSGGIKMVDATTGKIVGEMEGGEPHMILSRNTYANNKGVIDSLLYNSIYRNGAKIFANGGLIGTSPITSLPQTGQAGGNPSTEKMELLLAQLIIEIRTMKTRIEAYITYDNLDDAISEIERVKNRAGR